MSPSEIAFLALGIVLGAAIGAAIVEAVRSRPAPRREVRVTIAPNSVNPRRSSTLAAVAAVGAVGRMPGSPEDDAWFDGAGRRPSSRDLSGPAGRPGWPCSIEHACYRAGRPSRPPPSPSRSIARARVPRHRDARPEATPAPRPPIVPRAARPRGRRSPRHVPTCGPAPGRTRAHPRPRWPPPLPPSPSSSPRSPLPSLIGPSGTSATPARSSARSTSRSTSRSLGRVPARRPRSSTSAHRSRTRRSSPGRPRTWRRS